MKKKQPERNSVLEKIISGAQTGVDRAALDVAMEMGIPVGGYCPQGRKAEDGRIPDRYPVTELPTPDYSARTGMNVRVSDGTLILNMGRLGGGTGLTFELAAMHGKPCIVVQLDCPDREPGQVADWIRENRIRVLNVAGPRESRVPGVLYAEAFRYLRELLRAHP
jgi:hypothetical protein